MPTVSAPFGAIVIVTYNSGRHIRACLASLVNEQESWEVIVIDNGSKDDTRGIVTREFPWARLIDAGSNIGFSAASNMGARSSDAPLLLFLNPDTIVSAGALDRLVAAIEESGAAVVAPRLNGVDGEYQVEAAELKLPT